MPKVQSIDFGIFWRFGKSAEVKCRWHATAVVKPSHIGLSKVKSLIPPAPGRMPPAPRKLPWMQGYVPKLGAQSLVAPSCGGTVNNPRLSNSVSKASPKPARIDVRPLLPGEYAIPMRGAKLFFDHCGAPNVINPGSSAPEFRACSRSEYGEVVYS